MIRPRSSVGRNCSIAQQWKLFFCWFLLVTACCCAEDETKRAYTDVKDKTQLFIHVLKKDWSLALERLEVAPEEASILVERRQKSGSLVVRHMPIHQAFAGDISKEGYGERSEMSDEQLQLIKALLRLNPRVAVQKDLKKRSLLHLALASQVPPPVEVIRALIKANPHAVKAKDSEGRLPLHSAVASPMTTFENVEAVLNAYQGAVDVTDEDDALPIHLAAWGGDGPDSLPVVKLLVDANPSTLALKDSDDETVLTLMAKYGRTSSEALRYVIQQDPKALYRDRDERDGNTPLHYAVSASHGANSTIYAPILEHDAKAAEKINRIGKLPLHIALEQCCVSPTLVKDLVAAFPRAIALRDGEGFTPLHHVSQVGVSDIDIVKLLVEKAPKTLKHRASTKGADGPLPFHLAVRSEAQSDFTDDIILLLLKAYPDAALSKDPETELNALPTALMKKRSLKVLRKLMMLGPDTIPETFEVKDNEEKLETSALHMLVAMGPTYLNETDMVSITKDFLVMDPDGVKRKDGQGRTPLHIVWKDPLNDPEMLKSQEAVFKVLLEAYPDAAKVLDKQGRPPVAYASAARDEAAVNELLDFYPEGAKIKSKDGMYPLHYACGQGKVPVESSHIDKTVKRLLQEHPQAASHADDKGELPIHKVCDSTGPDGILQSTIVALLDAYPEATQQTDRYGNLPIHIAVNNAIQSEHPHQASYWRGLIRTLLERQPDAASRRDHRGQTPFSSGIRNVETLSHTRREEDDPALEILQMLYDKHPQSALEIDGGNRTTMHFMAQLFGDLGGMLPRSWKTLGIRIMRDYPELLQNPDKDGRTPLHLFILYLGDTAIGARDKQNPETKKHTDEIEEFLLTMLALYPDAMSLREMYDLTPFDLIDHKRLRFIKGSLAFDSSPIIKAVKRLLTRSNDYWKLAGSLERATISVGLAERKTDTEEPCDEIQGILAPLQQEMETQLKETGIELDELQPVESCEASTEGECGRCPEQNDLMVRLTAGLNRLATSSDAVDDNR